MSVEVEVAGETHQVPSPRESGWGQNLTNLLVAMAETMLTTVTALAAELDLGSTYGIRAKWFRSKTSSPASTGVVRLARADKVSWRNQADAADIELGVDTSNNLEWSGVDLVTATGTQTLTNKTIGKAQLSGLHLHASKVSAAQTVANTATVNVTFSSETQDSDAAFNGTTFTVPTGKGGLYAISATVTLDVNSGTAVFRVFIAKNGTSVIGTVDSYLTNAGLASRTASGFLRLADGDAITIKAYQSSGGDLSITNDALYTHLTIAQLAG